jgi:hypothetical protein
MSKQEIEESVYKVEYPSGHYENSMTWTKAVKIARQESGEYSQVYWVRHEHEYTPVIMFFCGRRYEPTEPE